MLVIAGIIVYNIYPAPEPQFERVLQREMDDKDEVEQRAASPTVDDNVV